MKNRFIFLVALSATLLIGFAAEAKSKVREASYETYNCIIDGIERTYKLYLPANIKPNAPLIFFLHGYGGSNNIDFLGANKLADKYGFAVCYPRGSKDGRGKHCWNVGYPFQKDMKADDISFMNQLARKLQKEHKLSRKNTFCTGMSNGGEMCYLLAYTEQKTFAAVAPIAGLTMEWFTKTYSPTRPMPIMEVHGTEDRTSEWTGDLENKGGWGAYIAVPDAIDYWVKVNGCKESTSEELPLKNAEANQVTLHKYFGGKKNSQVWLYEIKGGKHSWGNKDIDTAAEIWKFFTTFVR